MNWSQAVWCAGSWKDVKNICLPAWIVLGHVVYKPGRGDDALQVLTDGLCVQVGTSAQYAQSLAAFSVTLVLLRIVGAASMMRIFFYCGKGKGCVRSVYQLLV